uniref:Fungal lipase-like domain-containing protein n=1 Tax=Acrobeloides nanus TaxID=290746 RepID=A0A914CX70_9BILA
MFEHVAETAYDENFTREKITPIIAAVYAHTSEELMACLGNYFDDTLTLYKQYTVPCLGLFNDTCYAYIAIAQSEKLIFLSFRGSSVTEYLFENVNHITFAKKPWPLGGSILTYWYDSFFALWGSGLSDDLKSLLPTYQEQGFKLWVTGHSLGGVLAALNAQYIIAEGLYPETLVKYISFGECRIGDQIFAKQFDEMVPYKYRVINHRDPMTHQPYRLPTESGNTSFWHHHYEVWYPVQMCPGFNYTICHRAEDPNCSDSASANIDPTARDHFYYFGVSLTQWYTSGCNASEICQGYGYLQYLKDLAIYAVDP